MNPKTATRCTSPATGTTIRKPHGSSPRKRASRRTIGPAAISSTAQHQSGGCREAVVFSIVEVADTLSRVIKPGQQK
jgi:hypothetical protein